MCFDVFLERIVFKVKNDSIVKSDVIFIFLRNIFLYILFEILFLLLIKFDI